MKAMRRGASSVELEAAACKRTDHSGLHLSLEEENELIEALEDIRRGNFVDGRALLQELQGSVAARSQS